MTNVRNYYARLTYEKDVLICGVEQTHRIESWRVFSWYPCNGPLPDRVNEIVREIEGIGGRDIDLTELKEV